MMILSRQSLLISLISILTCLANGSYVPGDLYDVVNQQTVGLHIQGAGDVKLALEHLGTKIYEGPESKVYLVTVPIEGQSAVIKVQTGGWVYTSANAHTESRNLYTVTQLLAWGSSNANEKEDHQTWYFVMKNMGMKEADAIKAGMAADTIKQLKAEAHERYKTEFKMDHKDPNFGNYVYHKDPDDHWRAEIVDWVLASWSGESGKQPVNPLPREVVVKK